MTQTAKNERLLDLVPPHVLVVDDEPIFVDMVTAWLEQASYRTTATYSGEEALDLLGCRDGNVSFPLGPQELASPVFDLVLLDVSMPGLNGLEVCNRIRACAGTAKIPVLVLTALASSDNRLEALRAGANDYLTKPFEGVELLARVGNLVRWHRAEKAAQSANTALLDQLQRHSRKLDGLNQVMGLMMSELDLSSVLAVIVDGLVERWDAALARVWLVEQTGEEKQLVLHASAGLSTRLDGARARISLPGSCKIARLATERRELLSVDLAADLPIVDREWVRREGLRAFAGYPLFYKGQLTGVLALFSREVLLQSDFELLRTFAHQATAAIENARLYTCEQQRVSELTTLTYELERSQARLVQSEKMAAAGRLAASLAHEINNPLQAIHNCLALAKRFPLEAQEHSDYLALADQEVERLITLVRRILEFCRPSRGHRVLADLNALIEHVIALTLKKLQHSEIELCLDLVPGRLPVHVVTDQISQVILNLIINGIEAQPDGGRLELSSQSNGDWVEVTVIDSGPGLSPDQIEHLFEPFFTTKPTGTGLGLAISFGIVERHSGTIQVNSLDGKGAAFTVRLPAALEDEWSS